MRSLKWSMSAMAALFDSSPKFAFRLQKHNYATKHSHDKYLTCQTCSKLLRGNSCFSLCFAFSMKYSVFWSAHFVFWSDCVGKHKDERSSRFSQEVISSVLSGTALPPQNVWKVSVFLHRWSKRVLWRVRVHCMVLLNSGFMQTKVSPRQTSAAWRSPMRLEMSISTVIMQCGLELRPSSDAGNNM